MGRPSYHSPRRLSKPASARARSTARFDPLGAPGARTHGAEQAKALELAQHPPRPVLKRQQARFCRRALAQGLQIRGISTRRTGPPLQSQAQDISRLGRRQLQQGLIFCLRHQALSRRHIAAVDCQGQLADRPTKTPALTQHHGGLGQGLRLLGLQVLDRQNLTRGRLRKSRGGRAVAATLGLAAEIPQHRAGLHRGELVLVAQEDQARTGRQGLQQGRHHFQMDHGRLVHDQHIQLQRMGRIGAEGARVRPRTEQGMQGARGADVRGQLAQIEVRRQRLGQALQGRLDGLLESRRSLARGRGQGHAQGLALRVDGEQQCEQARGRVGLARARAAGDDGQAAAQGHGTGQLLPVQARGRCGEQAPQPGTQRRRVEPLGRGHARQHLAGHTLLVLPVAAQIKALALKHQRAVAVGRAGLPDQGTGSQTLRPLGGRRRQVQLGQTLRRLGAPAQQIGRVLAELRQGQAGMAAPFQMAEQGHGQQNGRIGLRVQLVHEAGQGRVQAAQPLVLHPGLQLLLQRGGRDRVHIHASSCSSWCCVSIKASSPSSSARGGRTHRQPASGPSMPRMKR